MRLPAKPLPKGVLLRHAEAPQACGAKEGLATPKPHRRRRGLYKIPNSAQVPPVQFNLAIYRLIDIIISSIPKKRNTKEQNAIFRTKNPIKGLYSLFD
jgi:hypothetical protein